MKWLAVTEVKKNLGTLKHKKSINSMEPRLDHKVGMTVELTHL